MANIEPAVGDETKLQLVLRKVSRRFVWFLFLLFVINFIDRGNIGIAALTMNRDLGISHSVFGLSLTIFAIGYAICEIPSNLMLARVGAPASGCSGSRRSHSRWRRWSATDRTPNG